MSPNIWYNAGNELWKEEALIAVNSTNLACSVPFSLTYYPLSNMLYKHANVVSFNLHNPLRQLTF